MKKKRGKPIVLICPGYKKIPDRGERKQTRKHDKKKVKEKLCEAVPNPSTQGSAAGGPPHITQQTLSQQGLFHKLKRFSIVALLLNFPLSLRTMYACTLF